MKKFISFVYDYHPLLFVFDKESNYHLWSCEAMLEAWYEVELVTYATTLKIEEDPNYNPKIKVVYFYNVLKLFGYIWKNREAVIYSNTLAVPSLLIGLIWKKTIFFSHSSVFPTKYSSWYILKKIFVKFCYRFFTKIRVINQYESDWLIREGFYDKGLIIPLVVPSKLLNKNISKDNNILLLWRVIPIKDPLTILKSLQLVIEKYPDLKIYQVGDYLEYRSSDNSTYQELLKKLWLNDNLILLWRKPVKDLKIQTSIYINSSLTEGQCIAAYDAMLLGNAVCLPNMSSFKEILNGKVLYHEPEDYVKLSENIIWYIEHPEEKEGYIKESQKWIIENLNYERIKIEIQKGFSL